MTLCGGVGVGRVGRRPADGDLVVDEAQVAEDHALRGGLAVSVEALRALWLLEERHFDVRLADDDALLVAPASKLTVTDRATIRRHRDDIRRLVRYCDEVTA